MSIFRFLNTICIWISWENKNYHIISMTYNLQLQSTLNLKIIIAVSYNRSHWIFSNEVRVICRCLDRYQPCLLKQVHAQNSKVFSVHGDNCRANWSRSADCKHIILYRRNRVVVMIDIWQVIPLLQAARDSRGLAIDSISAVSLKSYLVLFYHQ